MADFAKSSVVGLIAHQLWQTNPELLPDMSPNVDTVRNARVPATLKREFLDIIWRNSGPLGLLSIGQNIHEIGYDPIWHDAVRTENPQVFFEKWTRFEKFGHSRNRLHIDYDGQNSATCTRYSVHGALPTTPENLLVCGLIIALLEANGCTDLTCDMHTGDGSMHRIRQKKRFSVPNDFDALETSGWVVKWQGVTANGEEPKSSQTVPKINFSETGGEASRNWVNSVIRVLMQDVSRSWKVSALAQASGLSVRTLQRRLNDAGQSFSQLVRLVRIHEACRLLKKPEIPITTVGFCAGFSDSAHFSRDFMASIGMTPSDYRAAW